MHIPHISPASIAPRPLALADAKKGQSPISPSLSSLAQTQIPNSKSLQARSVQEICLPVDQIHHNDSIAKGIYAMLADTQLSLDKRLKTWILMKNYMQDKGSQQSLLEQVVKTTPEGTLVKLMLKLNYDSAFLKELEPFLSSKHDQADYINSYYTKLEAEKNQEIKNTALLDFYSRNLDNYTSMQLLHTMASNTLGTQELHLFRLKAASCEKLDTLCRIDAIAAISQHKPEEASALALILTEEIKTNGVNTELSPHVSSPQDIIINHQHRLLGFILNPEKKKTAEANLNVYLEIASNKA